MYQPTLTPERVTFKSHRRAIERDTMKPRLTGVSFGGRYWTRTSLQIGLF
jgi:hypothetical protein